MRLKSATWIILLALLSTAASAKSDRYEHRYSDDSDDYRKDRRYSEEYREDRRYSDDSDEYRKEKRYKKDKEHRKQKHLNRGMQKRLDRGKGLPPGWQKKLVVGERLDRDVYDHGVVVEPLNIRGEITIEVDQRLIRLHKATMEIIDILK